MKYKQVMYVVAMRHLSGIQKGIQGGNHAAMELALKSWDTKEFQQWIRRDKTLMVLQCNTTDHLEKTFKKLKKLGVVVADFHEPDFGNTLTAIAFLLDERVFNAGKYPDVDGDILALRALKNQFELATN